MPIQKRLKSHRESLKMCSTAFNQSLTLLALVTTSMFRFLRILLGVEASLVSSAATSTRHFQKSWRNSKPFRQQKLESLVRLLSMFQWLAPTGVMWFSKEVWFSNATLKRCTRYMKHSKTRAKFNKYSNLTLIFLKLKSNQKRRSWVSLKKLFTDLKMNWIA